MERTLQHPEGTVSIQPLGGKRSRLVVTMRDPGAYVSFNGCETSYPVDLIEQILCTKGPAYVCDEILRDEDHSYVESRLREDMSVFLDPAQFDGKRILDFGCGSGASTMALARLFPSASIVGVELEDRLLEVARARARLHRFADLEFMVSPSATELPERIGEFDLVVFSAVFEHLLPRERGPVLVAVWRAVGPGGVLFINQTPNRWFPIEDHTTGLPLLNYLPDRLAHWAARRFSRRVAPDETWEGLLRKGIRGGSERGILSLLASDGTSAPERLEPKAEAIGDSVDLWYHRSANRLRFAKSLLRRVLRFAHAVSGRCPVPAYLLMMFRKPPCDDAGSAGAN